MILVDADAATDLTQAYKVLSMPTSIVVKTTWDNVVFSITGASEGNINTVMSKALANK
jgi:hypothetical protein